VVLFSRQFQFRPASFFYFSDSNFIRLGPAKASCTVAHALQKASPVPLPRSCQAKEIGSRRASRLLRRRSDSSKRKTPREHPRVEEPSGTRRMSPFSFHEALLQENTLRRRWRIRRKEPLRGARFREVESESSHSPTFPSKADSCCRSYFSFRPFLCCRACPLQRLFLVGSPTSKVLFLRPYM